MKKCFNDVCKSITTSKTGYCRVCAKKRMSLLEEIRNSSWFLSHKHEKLENYSFRGLEETFLASKRWVTWKR